MKTVTVCITSFNRFEYLKKTVTSFLNLNTYPIARFLIIEDSGSLEMKEKILDLCPGKIDLIFNNATLGQPKSIDTAYKTITTDYIFHSEDDYEYSGNACFIQDSIDILEENNNIHQIWIRHPENYDSTHGVGTLENVMLDMSCILETTTNVKYRMVKSPHGPSNWCGFSWNPGLRRTSDYNRLFPKGYFHWGIQGEWAECACDHYAGSMGYRAAYLINSACNHIGFEKSTYNKVSIYDIWT